MDEVKEDLDELMRNRESLKKELVQTREELAGFVKAFDRCPKPLANLFDTVNALLDLYSLDSHDYLRHLLELVRENPDNSRSLRKEMQKEVILQRKFARQKRAFYKLIPQIPALLEAESRRKEKHITYLRQRVEELNREAERHKTALEDLDSHYGNPREYGCEASKCYN